MAERAIESGAESVREARWLARAARRVWRIWRNRTAMRKLLDLDDRMLRDIGLSRFDVQAALASSWWEDPNRKLQERASERRGARRELGGDRR